MGTMSTAFKTGLLNGSSVTDQIGYAAILKATGVENTGGSPAYARKAVAYTVVDGVATLTAPVVFDIAAGGQAGKCALFAAISGGAALGTDDLPTTEDYSGQGIYTLTAATITVGD